MGFAFEPCAARLVRARIPSGPARWSLSTPSHRLQDPVKEPAHPLLNVCKLGVRDPKQRDAIVSAVGVLERVTLHLPYQVV